MIKSENSGKHKFTNNFAIGGQKLVKITEFFCVKSFMQQHPNVQTDLHLQFLVHLELTEMNFPSLRTRKLY